jgi:toxin ParE1/3/4
VRIKILISAMEDMRSIKTYIAKDNPKAAVRMIKRIRAAVKHLKEFPYSGRIIPETSNPQLREVIVSNYRVMYQISDSSINIFAVYEGHNIPRIS